MTKNMRLHKGPYSPKLPYMKGEIRIGYKGDAFKVKGPLDKSLKAIIEKYGIQPEQLYSVSIVAMATVALGLSSFNALCITIT
jgi:hypothetical protein